MRLKHLTLRPTGGGFPGWGAFRRGPKKRAWWIVPRLLYLMVIPGDEANTWVLMRRHRRWNYGTLAVWTGR